MVRYCRLPALHGLSSTLSAPLVACVNACESRGIYLNRELKQIGGPALRVFFMSSCNGCYSLIVGRPNLRFAGQVRRQELNGFLSVGKPGGEHNFTRALRECCLKARVPWEGLAVESGRSLSMWRAGKLLKGGQPALSVCA